MAAQLCVYPDMAAHRLPALLDACLCATVNSDDPACFGGYINDNFIATVDALPQLGVRQEWQLARNSIDASSARAADKARSAQALDDAFARAA